MNIGANSDMAGEVTLIADELSRVVELAMSPVISHEARSQAYNACESFKENSPWCAQAGLLLASGAQYSPVVKHFGLQLMENTVKYRWTQITQAEKIFIKENAMKLLYMGGWEVGHLNDALARVIVEMIKREWPQQWPTLLSELSDACARGNMHTQIVLHVFLRLVEDVATLQTLEQNQRRKDIYQALTSNMTEIFAFFMRLTELHVQQFRERTAANDTAAAASHERVVQVVLVTLAGFLEWVSTSHVVSGEGRLLHMLCVLLQDAAFRLHAAECLLQVANRKGSIKERKPLLILYNEEAMTCLHRAAAVQSASPTANDAHYLFLKKLSQVLVGLAQQLTTLYSHATNVESWLPLFLETMLLMTSHPSLTLAQAANSVWVAFLKHDQISKLPHILAIVPRWLQAAAPKILKVSYPSCRSGSGSVSDSYVLADYDSEQDFAVFFHKCRTEILEGFRYAMCAAPLVTWGYVEQWTRAALDKLDSCPPDLSFTHPLYVEWEALSQVLDVVLSRLVVCSPRPSAADGLAVLARCVASRPQHPLLLSLLLSFISALFVFLSCAYSQLAGPGVGAMGAELLPLVLDKVFAALVFEGDRKDRNVKNVRRHAAGLLVKLGSKYPLLLLPVFGRLHSSVNSALSRPDLSAVESVTLQEALLLVANHFCCFDRQSQLVAQVLGDCSSRWSALGPHVDGAAALAALVGLDSPPVSTPPAGTATEGGTGGTGGIDDEHGRARRALLHALTLLLGVVKRTQVPTDPDKAMRGGFSAGTTPSGNPIWRNPCAAHVLPLFPHALALIRSLHDLHAPENAHLRHPLHAKALCLSTAEKRNLLGLRDYDANTPSGPADRMQVFLHTLHENVCHLVGAAASTLGRELYAAAGVSRWLCGSLLHGLQHLPDHWLRPIVRAALKPLLLHCPPAHYQTVALPIAEHAYTFMSVHLTQRWEYIASLYESGKLEEEGGSESQEVLEDMLVRNLTREYLEVLKISLVEGGSLIPEANAGDMDEDSPSGGGGTQRAPDTVSELGAMVLQHPVAGPAALHTILRALTWQDSLSSLRASSMALAALRCSVAAGRVREGDAAAALAHVLQALRTHGQHDANRAALLALAVQSYEALRPLFPEVVMVLRALPGVEPTDVARLDDRLATTANANANASATPAKHAKADKVKRDLFKKITARLIGRNVGQLFKKEVYILNLPSMPVLSKEKARGPLDSAEGANLSNFFNAHAQS